MTLFYTKNSVSDFYSPTLFIIEPKGIKIIPFFIAFLYFSMGFYPFHCTEDAPQGEPDILPFALFTITFISD